jgi:protoporphyrinogen oxidase
MPNIAIIGSGFLGLTLALRLRNRGDRVTVFESAPEIGGLASAWQIGDVTWDRHYHVTLLSDSFTRKIVEEIGLGDEFEWVETKTGFYTDGKLVSMSSTPEFLKFPPLGIVSKLRLGGTIFFASRVKDWKALEKISVEDWLTKLSGKKTFEKMWKPLLKAKLGEAYKETSAAFIWATIQRMYAARNSGLKKEMFGYVRGGYARVLKRFEQVLREKGVDIHLNSRVSDITRDDNGKFQVSTGSKIEDQSSKIDSFDNVIFTGPSNIAAKIIPDLTAEEKQKLRNIRYQGIVCASVLMKESLSPFYVTNITDETPFTGIIEMSALVDKTEFGGRALVYLPKYVAPNDELFERTDAEIEETFLTALEKMYPHFDRKGVDAFKISRVRQVFPLPVLDYSAYLPSINTSVAGLYVVNSAHIVNGTLNVNETVQLAERFYNETFAGINETVEIEMPFSPTGTNNIAQGKRALASATLGSVSENARP